LRAIAGGQGRQHLGIEDAPPVGRIGFDRTAGFLDGGMVALAQHPELVRQTPRLTAPELRDRLSSPQPPLVLDVRAASERAQKSIDPSQHVPLPQLSLRIGELPRDRALVVHCASGYRSAIACSLLEAAGFTPSDLVGGIASWHHNPATTVEQLVATLDAFTRSG
jgi:hydroxyacylglutathione hydrolase